LKHKVTINEQFGLVLYKRKKDIEILIIFEAKK